MKVKLRQRLSQADAHYGGDLVDGARILALFGDAATELLIRHDGDEGLFRAYHFVDFLAPVYAGDFIEVEAEIVKVGKTSRKMIFHAYKVITPLIKLKPSTCVNDSAAQTLEEPLLVVKAEGTCVVPKDCQRFQESSSSKKSDA